MTWTLTLAMSAAIPLCVATINPAVAQTASISLAGVTCQFRADTVIAGGNPRFVLVYTNNTGEKVDVSNGFKISSPDGAHWDSVTIDTLGYHATGESSFAQYFEITFALMHGGYSGVDTVGVLGSGRPTQSRSQLPNGYSDTAIAITIWNLSWVNATKHVCIDTSFFQPGGTWTWVGRSLDQYYPAFLGLPGLSYSQGQAGSRLGSGYCFYIYDLPCTAPGGNRRQLSESEAAACTSCFSCCIGLRGNVNLKGIVDLADLSSLANYLTGGGLIPPCVDAANVDGSGVIDLSDLTALVTYLIGSGYVLPNCGS